MDGSQVDFFNWYVGEPNNAGTGEDCAEMIADTAEWNDVDCGVVRRVTCRYQPCNTKLKTIAKNFSIILKIHIFYLQPMSWDAQ